jgi:integrase
VDASRARYLTPEECKRLINGSSGAFRDLVLAALFTGCRYSELTRVVASDFNPDSGTLAIRMSKTGTPRHVVLSEERAKLFSRLSMGKSASGLLLLRDDGAAWEKVLAGPADASGLQSGPDQAGSRLSRFAARLGVT